MHEDRRLARRVAQGDPRAFEELLDAYGGRVHRLVRRQVANPADAEDVTQEVFIAVYRSIGTFRGDASLSTWVYRIALNHCLKHRQRTAPAAVPYEDGLHAEDGPTVDPQACAAQRELADRLQSALGVLSEQHRDVVVLHELHGLTYQECADLLQVPVGTVKSRLSNAFRRLRESLSGYVLGDSAQAQGPARGFAP